MAAASTAVLVLMFTVAGASLGAAARSRMRLRRPRISWLVVVVVGLALRFVADSGAAAFQFQLLVASFVLLLIFCGRNLTWPGMTVVALGLVLTLAPTLANRGMPVGTNAALAAGTVSLSGARHLQQPGDVLMVLAEILPLRVASRALSFGELITLVGLGDVLFHAVARRPARHTASSRGSRGRQGDISASRAPCAWCSTW